MRWWEGGEAGDTLLRDGLFLLLQQSRAHTWESRPHSACGLSYPHCLPSPVLSLHSTFSYLTLTTPIFTQLKSSEPFPASKSCLRPAFSLEYSPAVSSALVLLLRLSYVLSGDGTLLLAITPPYACSPKDFSPAEVVLSICLLSYLVSLYISGEQRPC